MASNINDAEARLARLLGYLEHDPRNASLLRDAAQAAMSARAFDQAEALLARLAELGALAPSDQDLAARLAIAQGNSGKAIAILSPLMEAHGQDPSLRFNLAWAFGMEERFDEALALLDASTIAASAPAAMLEVQVLHASGRYEEALKAAKANVERYPEHPGLLAAASTIAIDAEDMNFARACAVGAQGHPDAETTLGTLALADDSPESARAHFETALTRAPNSPRALVGRGLTALLAGDHKGASRDIERGAELFKDHIGSWIAAGWARLIAGDTHAARQHFEHALAIDPSFSESQGSLAVIAAMEGNVMEARKLGAIALRLDRNSFSGAFANALIIASEGDSERAHAIIERALNTPIEPGGKTIAHSLARYGLFA